MRVTKIDITEWRTFRDIEINIPESATLVCLVGENGTGKSNLLELVSAAGNRVGLSTGISLMRGDPFAETHEFAIEFLLSKLDPKFHEVTGNEAYNAAALEWDGKLQLTSKKIGDEPIETWILAGGISNVETSKGFGAGIARILRQREEVQHLYIDADRSYARVEINPNQYAAAVQVNWDDEQRTGAAKASKNLYEEWFRYVLAADAHAQSAFWKESRRVKEEGVTESPDIDKYDSLRRYADSIQEVLPHLRFLGADDQTRALTFSSGRGGQVLSFHQLSAGEREVAFLVGQIERFGLRRGLFLIDEPELHLNPALIRTWVDFLERTIDDGQVWFGTHSIEVVEASGVESTFVLERSADDRIVRTASALAERPALQVLAGALGAPGFSIENETFVLIEGERGRGQRERFDAIVMSDASVHFMESGGCGQVVEKVSNWMSLAEQSGHPLRIGGVIDRDFRSEAQINELTASGPIYVLQCHEIENLFLRPDGLQVIANRSQTVIDAEQLLREASDDYAGAWILQQAVAVAQVEVGKGARELAWKTKWAALEDGETFQSGILADTTDAERLEQALKDASAKYTLHRDSDDLWAQCMGKQVIAMVAKALGFSNARTLEDHIIHTWQSGEVALPEEVASLREYVTELYS